MENKINLVAAKWFEVKVKGSILNEKGNQKLVTRKFVISGETWGDCEKNVYSYCTDHFVEINDIVDISVAQYGEIAFDENDCSGWYKVKVYIEDVDDNGKEKKNAVYFLTNANSVDKAQENIESVFYGTIADFSIGCISDTNIVNVLGV